jgi:nucleoside phosphorylase
VGDIVLGVDCVNYDMDVTAFEPFPGCKFPRGTLPFIDWREYAGDARMLELARAAPLPEAFVAKGGQLLFMAGLSLFDKFLAGSISFWPV